MRVIGFEPIRDRSREILSLLRLPISPYSHIYAQIFSCYATQRILSLLRLPIPPQRRMKFGTSAQWRSAKNCYAPSKNPSTVAAATAPRKAYRPPRSPPCYKKSIARDDAFRMEAPPGFEPGSQGFADLCLTTWLWRQKNSAESTFGAGNETRTRDIHLGKVTLYH